MSEMTTEKFETYAKNAGEPRWFTEKRSAAFDKAKGLPMPSFQKIKYHRWPIQLEKELVFSKSELDENEKSVIDDSENLLIEFGQSTDTIKISEELKEKGVIVADLKTALTEHRELFERYYMQKAVNRTACGQGYERCLDLYPEKHDYRKADYDLFYSGCDKSRGLRAPCIADC